MGTAFAYLEKCLKFFVIVAIGLMLLLTFTQVISRYVFNYTPSFMEELSRYLFVWTVFLSLPLVAKSGGHMAIEALTSRISGSKLKFCRFIGDICTIIFLVVMVWQGVRMVQLAHFQTSPAMMLPMSYVYAVIPFGCFIMLLYVINNILTLLRTAPEDVK